MAWKLEVVEQLRVVDLFLSQTSRPHPDFLSETGKEQASAAPRTGDQGAPPKVGPDWSVLCDLGLEKFLPKIRGRFPSTRRFRSLGPTFLHFCRFRISSSQRRLAFTAHLPRPPHFYITAAVQLATQRWIIDNT